MWLVACDLKGVVTRIIERPYVRARNWFPLNWVNDDQIMYAEEDRETLTITDLTGRTVRKLHLASPYPKQGIGRVLPSPSGKHIAVTLHRVLLSRAERGQESCRTVVYDVTSDPPQAIATLLGRRAMHWKR